MLIDGLFVQDPQQPPGGTDVGNILRSNSPSNFFFESHVSILTLLANMAVGLLLALALQWHYRRFSTSLSNRQNFAKVFPLVMLTTVLIITVVKSSLALSLGLVGALSIVRFRTPIKEPEELAYLFICIAIGLGLGASQTMVTIVGAAVILVAASIVAVRRRRNQDKNLYLSVAWRDRADLGSSLDELNAAIGEHVARHDLRRVDARDSVLEASYLLGFSSPGEVAKLLSRLHRDYKGIDVTFIDQDRLVGP